MYISSFLTLDTALSGVEAAQEELDTTGQNITNENTAGYEEQIVNLSESQSLNISGSGADGALQLGTGVTATSITNSGDPYLDAAWRQQNAATTGATTTEGFMSQIESALNEPNGSGISSQLSTFWTDWNDLADNPNDAAAQQAVVQQGESVATAFNSLSTALNGDDPTDPTDATNSSSVLGQVNSQYMATMEGPTAAGASGGTLYNDAYNISSLNYSIVQAEAAGQSPNDLIDQRNAALDSLSQLGNTQVQNNSDGSVTVYFGGVTGTALISDPAGDPPGGTVPPGDNFGTYGSGGTSTPTGWVAAFQGQYASAATAGTSAATLANTVGGTLGSLIGLAGYSGNGFGNLGAPTEASGVTSYSTPTMATEDGTIGTLTASLDAVANDLATEVNSPTQTGSSTTLTLNAPFFTASSGTTITAATLAVTPSLVSAAASGITPQAVSSATAAGANTQGTTNVQTSSLAVSPPATIASNASDNDVALDEAANAGGTADTAYQAFVQQVGSLAQGAENQATTASALQTQITNQRTSVEGVDLSQEMANLINEQQAYQASAKVMNAFSTVMDSLMTVVGQ
ncbi:MAG TPA: flagellar basal body rod C-terminal domain-containing protein [Solirubrobacteraceae bacterium]|nr:flagellar basal body rod C-terminal domain-containing protein [Solirubrobacteraceae bacterium]